MTTQNGSRANPGWGLVRLVKLYNDNIPFRKGKMFLAAFALRHATKFPGETIVSTFDGRRLYTDMAERGMYGSVYFVGEFEPAVTKVISAMVRPGDVCLDLGANFGWYTTLLHRLVGADGSVQAFEPVPRIFAKLVKNLELAGAPVNIKAFNLALGDRAGTAVMHTFAGLPDGHSSMSAQGRDDFVTVETPVVTLDDHLQAHPAGSVSFVKMDVEGAELMCLQGAGSLFRQPVPPIWMIEMAEATARSFGHLPNDLIEFMRSRADYEFFAVDEVTKDVFPITGFAPNEIGANVLCVPAGQYRDRLRGVAQRPAGSIAKVPR